MKIKNIKPSYPEQHWVDLNNYHINKVLEKGIKVIVTKGVTLGEEVTLKDNKVTFPPDKIKWFKIIQNHVVDYLDIKNKFGNIKIIL
jgi:DNA/RNA endonuclease G (NUC1)